MGQKSKRRRSDQRRKNKKAAKEARKALYKSYGEQGKERKTDGVVKQRSNRRHPTRPCGNFGCDKCYPKT
jgi:hypothetical protein